jgi:hypothetical protein
LEVGRGAIDRTPEKFTARTPWRRQRTTTVCSASEEEEEEEEAKVEGLTAVTLNSNIC